MKRTKKLLAGILSATMIMSMGLTAFAANGTDRAATLQKQYNRTNAGTTSPEEEFTFTATCTGVEEAGEGVATGTAPVLTIDSAEFTKGDAGETGADVKTLNITPDKAYPGVGVYIYSVVETDNKVAGVTYADAMTLKVTVTQGENGLDVKYTAYNSTNEKSEIIVNEYSAGSLVVGKQVTGNMGDRNKEFEINVTFEAPTDTTVKSDITYGDNTIEAGEGWTTRTVSIKLKHNENITFSNIPYGVTYTVDENDYTTDAKGAYDAPIYDYSDSDGGAIKTIDSVSETATVTNNKGRNVDTGINMDSLPYILVFAGVLVIAAIAFISRRRRMEY